MEEDQREDFLLPHVVGPRTVGRGGSRSHRPGSGFRPPPLTACEIRVVGRRDVHALTSAVK